MLCTLSLGLAWPIELIHYVKMGFQSSFHVLVFVMVGNRVLSYELKFETVLKDDLCLLALTHWVKPLCEKWVFHYSHFLEFMMIEKSVLPSYWNSGQLYISITLSNTATHNGTLKGLRFFKENEYGTKWITYVLELLLHLLAWAWCFTYLFRRPTCLRGRLSCLRELMTYLSK